MVNIVFQWQRSDLIDRVSHDPMCERIHQHFFTKSLQLATFR